MKHGANHTILFLLGLVLLLIPAELPAQVEAEIPVDSLDLNATIESIY